VKDAAPRPAKERFAYGLRLNQEWLAASDEADAADHEARLLEELKKITLSELVNRSPEASVAKAEHWARAHEKYREAMEKAVAARTEANRLKARAEKLHKDWETWRTMESSRRTELRMTAGI